MKTGVEMVEALRYELIILGFPIDGSYNLFWYNKYIYNNNITPYCVINNNRSSFLFYRNMYTVSTNTIGFDDQGA